MSSSTSYRLVLVDKTRQCCFVDQFLTLPVVEIPRFKRTAHALTRWIADSLRIDALQLADLKGPDTSKRVAVFEVLSTAAYLPTAHWLAVSVLKEILPPEHWAVVRQMLETDAGPQGRYSNFGWFDALRQDAQIEAIHNLQHWNFGFDFCLLSFQTSRGLFWLKGVGHTNGHEFRSTPLLAEVFPEFVPRLWKSFPSRQAWISHHADGVPIGALSDERLLQTALDNFARLQIASVDRLDALEPVSLGFVTPSSIQDDLDAFFHDAGVAMAAQSSSKVPRLSTAELGDLKLSSQALCDSMETCALPIALHHGDPVGGNILVRNDGITVLDWSELYLGCPLISCVHIVEGLSCSASLSSQKKDRLIEHYLSSWRTIHGHADWDRAKVLSHAFAALSFAITLWRRNRGDAAPPTWPLLRSVIRKLQNELGGHAR